MFTGFHGSSIAVDFCNSHRFVVTRPTRSPRLFHRHHTTVEVSDWYAVCLLNVVYVFRGRSDSLKCFIKVSRLVENLFSQDGVTCDASCLALNLHRADS